MSVGRSIRNVQRRSTNGNEECEMDDSDVLEGKLRKLLNPNKRTLNRPRNVFDNIKEDIPKLRRSIVARALQTYVCSTPMPKEPKRDFFCTENSLNISPISPDSKQLETEEHDNKEQINRRQNEDKKKTSKEAMVSLIRSPIQITISDSSNEPNMESSRNINSNSKQVKSPYNTRSSDTIKMTKEITQKKENSPNNIKSKKHRISSDSWLHKNNAQDQEGEASENLNSEKNSLRSNSRPNKRIKRKGTNKYKIGTNPALKKHESSNLSSSNNTESDLYSRSRSRSRGQKELVEHENLELKQLESNTTYHELQVDICKGKTENPSKTNKSEKETSRIRKLQINIDKVNKNKSINKNNILDANEGTNKTDSQRSINVTRRNHEQSLKEISHCITKTESPLRVSPRKIAHNATRNAVQNQEDLPSKKLSFLQRDEDIEQNGNISALDKTLKKNKKSKAKVNKPMENQSKIPVLRSRSKSREKSVDTEINILRSTSREHHLNECSESTDQENNYNNSKHNVDQKWSTPKSPPKRPPRKKAKQKKRNILGQVLESTDKSTITTGSLEGNGGTPPKQMKIGSEKYIVQNGTSPDKLETSQKRFLTRTSPRNKKENPKNIKVVKNILILDQTLVGSRLEENAKVYIEKGTSPFTSGIEIKTTHPGNNILVSDNCEQISKSDKVPADCEEDLNLEKALVEVGTSPIKFAEKSVDNLKNPAMSGKTLADAGTSTWNFENALSPASKAEIDRTRATKLDKLLESVKLRKKYDNLETPKDQIASESRLEKINTIVDMEPLAKTCSERASPLKSTSREIQTSLRSPCQKKCFQNSLPVVVEQQTQTTSSLIVEDKRMERNTKDSKSDESDSSDFLREYDRDRPAVLFQSLANDIASINFTSSDDDVFEDTLRSNRLSNLPWRLDDNLFPQQRKSSLKLNFIRSAHEIETEQSCSKVHNSLHSSDSDNKLVAKKFEKQKFDELVFGNTGKNKLQSYSRANLQNKEDQSQCAKLDSTKCTDEKRSSSSHSSMSDLVISDSMSKNNHECQEIRDVGEDGETPVPLVNRSPSQLSDINSAKNKHVNATEVIRSPQKIIETNNMPSLIVAVENHQDLSLDKRKSHEHIGESVEEDDIKGIAESAKKYPLKKKYRSTKKCNGKRQKLMESQNESEILATPLEESEIPLLQPKDIVDKPHSTQSPNILSDNMEDTSSSVKACRTAPQSEFKVPKTRVHRAKKTVDSEIDGGVSSTVIDSTDSGVRRSLRERKPLQRRFCGAIATTSKKDIDYYNASLVPPCYDDTILPRPSTQKKSLIKTTRKESRSKGGPVIKKGRTTGKGTDQIEEELENSNFININCTEDLMSEDELPLDMRISRVNNISAVPDGDNSKINEEQNCHITRSRSKAPVIKKGRTAKNVKKQIKEKSEKSNFTKNINSTENPMAEEKLKKSSFTKNTNSTENPMAEEKLEESNFTKNINSTENSMAEEKLEKSNFTTNINSTENPMAEEELPLDTPISDEVYNILEVSAHGDNSKVNKGCKRHITESTTENTSLGKSHLTPKRGKMSNDNNFNTKNTNDSISQKNINKFDPEPEPDCNIDSAFHNGSIEENTQDCNLLDKDSGRSTMSRSSLLSNRKLRPSRRTTGRINKKYKKRKNISKKTSKVLSSSINNSRETDILNGNKPNVYESVSVTQSALRKPEDSQYLDLLCNENSVSMKYVEMLQNFVVIDDVEVAAELKNPIDGVGMGFFKLAPGFQKPLIISRKFSLYYFVFDGEASIQVRNKTSRVEKFGRFIVPIGYEYSIKNMSQENPLLLGYIKLSPNVG